jgi:hypothetical protein
MVLDRLHPSPSRWGTAEKVARSARSQSVAQRAGQVALGTEVAVETRLRVEQLNSCTGYEVSSHLLNPTFDTRKLHDFDYAGPNCNELPTLDGSLGAPRRASAIGQIDEP